MTAAGGFFVAALVGALGYHTIGQGMWSFPDCFYMSVITISTVGFGETLPGMAQVPGARAWTVLQILFGSGALVYFVSTLTALLVEGDLRGLLRRRKMRRDLNRITGHVIVVGGGITGEHVLQEITGSGVPIVVVEPRQERIDALTHRFGDDLLYVLGDGTEDEALQLAGVERAIGLVTTLRSDRDNLFVTITARSMSERLRIVAKAVEDESVSKLRRAGADAVVATPRIGGLRMASELLRPTVVGFLDTMLRESGAARRIEELPVPATSRFVGQTLGDLDLGSIADALVIAVREAEGGYVYNPPRATPVAADMVLIVMIRVDDLALLRGYLLS